MDSAMISDDAPNPRNGKIIQCRVLARTLWVPWAGSLAEPWREAPCHYAAGPHHPHQYPIFGAPPQRASSTNPLGIAAVALLSFSAARAVSLARLGPPGPVLFHGVLLFYASRRRRPFVYAASRVNRRREKVSPCTFCRTTRVTCPRLLTLFRMK